MQNFDGIPISLQVRLEPPLYRVLVELAEQRFQSRNALIKGLILKEATDAGMRPEPQRGVPLTAAAAGAGTVISAVCTSALCQEQKWPPGKDLRPILL